MRPPLAAPTASWAAVVCLSCSRARLWMKISINQPRHEMCDRFVTRGREKDIHGMPLSHTHSSLQWNLSRYTDGRFHLNGRSFGNRPVRSCVSGSFRGILKSPQGVRIFRFGGIQNGFGMGQICLPCVIGKLSTRAIPQMLRGSSAGSRSFRKLNHASDRFLCLRPSGRLLANFSLLLTVRQTWTPIAFPSPVY